MDMQAKINLVAIPAILSQEAFATFVGKPESTVRGWVATRAIPTVKVGGSRMIDFHRMTTDLRDGKEQFVKGDYDE